MNSIEVSMEEMQANEMLIFPFIITFKVMDRLKESCYRLMITLSCTRARAHTHTPLTIKQQLKTENCRQYIKKKNK